MNNYKITILHLYPDLLDLYGDKGNIECLKKRLIWRGIDAEVINCTTQNDNIDFGDIDIIFLGGGTDKAQTMVLEKLTAKKEELKGFIENGGTLLATSGGFELIAKTYPLGEEQKEGLSLLNINAKKGDKGVRFTGDVVLDCDTLGAKLVGFENHTSRMDIGEYTPLGKVEKGNGNDGESGCEGIIYKNVIGTYLTGPLLPKNPELCDRILLGALKNKYPEFESLSLLDNGLEILAKNYIINRS